MSPEMRITELESRLAFQDDTIQALNDVLVTQQRVLDRLERQVAALAKRQEDIQGQLGVSQEDAPPPHY